MKVELSSKIKFLGLNFVNRKNLVKMEDFNKSNKLSSFSNTFDLPLKLLQDSIQIH